MKKERRARLGMAPKAKSKPKANSTPCRAALEEKEDAEEEDEESWGGWSVKGHQEVIDLTRSFELKVTNVEGHTHEYLKEIITRFGNGARPMMRSKEGKDTAVLAFKTREEATLTLIKGIRHRDPYWPKMEWSRAAFTAFGTAENVYTKNPTSTTREEQSQERGKDWQDKKQNRMVEPQGGRQPQLQSMVPQSKENMELQVLVWKAGMGTQTGICRWRTMVEQRTRTTLLSSGGSIRAMSSERSGETRTSIQLGIRPTVHYRSGRCAGRWKRRRGAKNKSRNRDEKKGPGKPSRSEEAKNEDDPPQELRNAVDSMRKHQRLRWHKICRTQITRAVQMLAEDEEDGKVSKKRRGSTPERGARNPEGKGDASEATGEEGKINAPEPGRQPDRPPRRVACRRKKQKGAPQKIGKKTRSPSRQKERNTGGKEQ